ncbi:MAG: hypothetical protein ACI4MN_05950 [Candidatus Coproplasma sp.]
MAKKGSDNLIPFNQRTEDEQRKIASAGGKKSGEARRRRKKLKKEFEDILKMAVTNPQYVGNLAGLGIDATGSTYQTVMAAAMIVKACNGNVLAYEAIKETIEPPKAKPDNSEAVTDHLKLMREAFSVGDSSEDYGDE